MQFDDYPRAQYVMWLHPFTLYVIIDTFNRQSLFSGCKDISNTKPNRYFCSYYIFYYFYDNFNAQRTRKNIQTYWLNLKLTNTFYHKYILHPALYIHFFVNLWKKIMSKAGFIHSYIFFDDSFHKIFRFHKNSSQIIYWHFYPVEKCLNFW